MDHRLRLLGSMAVLSVTMGVTGCRARGSLPCAAWCLLCCHWPDMMSFIYPRYCCMREALFLHHHYACVVPQAQFMTYLQTEKTNLYSHKDYSATRAVFL